MRSPITALVFITALAGYASASDVSDQPLDTASSGADNPLLITLSVDESQRATGAITRVLNEPASATFSNVYGVRNQYSGTGYVVCGSVTAKNLSGDDVVQRYFAVSEGRALIIDEVSNAALASIAPRQQISLKHKVRPFIGSWWAQCRPHSFTKLVQSYQEEQRAKLATR